MIVTGGRRIAGGGLGVRFTSLLYFPGRKVCRLVPRASARGQRLRSASSAEIGKRTARTPSRDQPDASTTLFQSSTWMMSGST
jgi:hypothetical protein